MSKDSATANDRRTALGMLILNGHEYPKYRVNKGLLNRTSTNGNSGRSAQVGEADGLFEGWPEVGTTFVDVSGSMAGYKLEAVNRHLKLLLSEIDASAETVHLYTFAETVQRQAYSRNPGYSVRNESTSYEVLGDYISSLAKNRATGSMIIVYSDGLVVEDRVAVEDGERFKRQFETAYSSRVGILVSSTKQQDNIVHSLSNKAVFSIDEDVCTIAAVLRPVLCERNPNRKPSKIKEIS